MSKLKYWRAKSNGNVYSSNSMVGREIAPGNPEFERVVVKRRERRTEVREGDRVVTVKGHFLGPGRKGIVVADDGSSCPFRILLDEPWGTFTSVWAKRDCVRRTK